MFLNVKMLARAIGITWSAGLILLGIIAGFGYGEALVELLSSIYIGYDSSFLGILAGGAWGLVDGMIAGALIAYIYNMGMNSDSTKRL